MKIRFVAQAALLVCLWAAPQMTMAMRPAAWTPVVAPKAGLASQASAKTHQATGEVLSASAGSLILLHARGRTKQKMAFTLTQETKTTASLIKGERVVVFYREAGGRRIAVRIRSATPARRMRQSR